MTVTDIRLSNSIEFEIEKPVLGEITPGKPVYMVPDNPWLTWANRSGGLAIGAWAAATITLLLTPRLLGWMLASAVAVTLLFAWVVAGHELYEKNPRKFRKAP